MAVRRGFLLALAAVALSAAACSKKQVPVYPVRGSVSFEGKPATKAVVVLRALTDSGPVTNVPHGEVGPDGTFVIGTFSAADGAPAGEYAVTITWPEVKVDPETRDRTESDRLEGRYRDPKESKWKVRIVEGNNQIGPFAVD
jgi:hypothetical protein